MKGITLNWTEYLLDEWSRIVEAYRDDNQMATKKCSLCGEVFSNRKYDKLRVHFLERKKAIFILHQYVLL